MLEGIFQLYINHIILKQVVGNLAEIIKNGCNNKPKQ